MLRSSNSVTTFSRAPTRSVILSGENLDGVENNGPCGAIYLPIVPMAPPIPPIESKSSFLEGNLEKNYYHYTDRLVTRRSPKLCMDGYQWHGGIRLNTHLDGAAARE